MRPSPSSLLSRSPARGFVGAAWECLRSAPHELAVRAGAGTARLATPVLVGVAMAAGASAAQAQTKWFVSNIFFLFEYEQGSGVVTNQESVVIPGGEEGWIGGIEYAEGKKWIITSYPNNSVYTVANGVKTLVAANVAGNTPLGESDLGYRRLDRGLYFIEAHAFVGAGLHECAVWRLDVQTYVSSKIGTFQAEHPVGLAFDKVGNGYVLDHPIYIGPGAPRLIRIDVNYASNPGSPFVVKEWDVPWELAHGGVAGMDFHPKTDELFFIAATGNVHKIGRFPRNQPALVPDFVEEVAIGFGTDMAFVSD